MRYMIHSVPSRQWYVDKYLIPSMLEQGISRDDIFVWCDTNKKGNLYSCMESFKYCGENQANGTWHLQDDIIIGRKFAKATKEYNFGIVAGFVVKEWGLDWTKTGNQTVEELWYSFQCIRIPDQLAGECANWFFTDAQFRRDQKYSERVQAKKHDDDFFLYFLQEKYPRREIINLKPNIVDHIDYLIGGTLINKTRETLINRAAYWEDEDLVEKLEKDLKKGKMDEL